MFSGGGGDSSMTEMNRVKRAAEQYYFSSGHKTINN
jgi:hypothetical protein